MPSWPASLPAPTVSGYGIDPADQTIRTDMEAGAARTRRRSRARMDMINVVWKFTDAQMAVFRAWFEDDVIGAAGGAGWFTVSLATGDSGITSREAKFNGTFKPGLLPGMNWQVTAKLEVRGGDLTADQRLARILGLVVDGVYPSLVLAFSDVKALDSRITFTRNSIATYFDANGVMQTAAANAARFDHDPVTGESLGLLIEEARTNLLTYSEQFDNADWQKYGVTVLSNQAAAPDGTATMDAVTFAAAGGSLRHAFSGGVATYTLSFWAQAAAGDTVTLGLDVSDSPSSTIVVTDVPQRYSVTMLDGGGGSFVDIQTPAGATDKTVYMWGAQFEAGAFATSYIPTTSVAVARNADVATMTGTNFSGWYNASEGTLFAAAEVIYAVGASTVCNIADPSGLAERMQILSLSSVGSLISATASVITASIGSGSIDDGTAFKIAGAFAANDFAVSTNAAAVATDTSGAMASPTECHIGRNSDGAAVYLNGHIKRLAYYPARLTNAQLQALTA